jgi:hypothetical protein
MGPDGAEAELHESPFSWIYSIFTGRNTILGPAATLLF